MQEVTGKYRVSDRALDDAVHQLALMCVQSAMKDVPADFEDLPNVAADQYCIASEMIRKRINEQRLKDGSRPETWWGHGDQKTWFYDTVTESCFVGAEKINRP